MEREYKTYESIYSENGTNIIVARGKSEQYVLNEARLSGMVPCDVVSYQDEDDVRDMYRDWRKENKNQKPNRVIVRMRWDDETDEDNTLVDTIAIDPRYDDDNLPPDDTRILFYVSSLEELLTLMKPNNGSEFTVLEVLEFWKRK